MISSFIQSLFIQTLTGKLSTDEILTCADKEGDARHEIQEGLHLQQREEVDEHHRAPGLGRLPGVHQGRLRDHHEEVQLPRRQGRRRGGVQHPDAGAARAGKKKI